MKRLIIITWAVIAILMASAQRQESNISFLGKPLGETTIGTLNAEVESKGYEFRKQKNGVYLYDGAFEGHPAELALFTDDETGEYVVSACITLERVNPMAAGQLYAELMQSFMQKYSHYQYMQETKGSKSTVAFTNGPGIIALTLQTKMLNCTIQLYYINQKISSDKEAQKPSGIGASDL